MSQTNVGISLVKGSWVNHCQGIQVEVNNKQLRYFDISNLRKLDLKTERAGDVRYTMSDGDRLDILADLYYQNQLLWWVIAYRNYMYLPIAAINAGVKIIIPDPSYISGLGL